MCSSTLIVTTLVFETIQLKQQQQQQQQTKIATQHKQRPRFRFGIIFFIYHMYLGYATAEFASRGLLLFVGKETARTCIYIHI